MIKSLSSIFYPLETGSLSQKKCISLFIPLQTIHNPNMSLHSWACVVSELKNTIFKLYTFYLNYLLLPDNFPSFIRTSVSGRYSVLFPRKWKRKMLCEVMWTEAQLDFLDPTQCKKIFIQIRCDTQVVGSIKIWKTRIDSNFFFCQFYWLKFRCKIAKLITGFEMKIFCFVCLMFLHSAKLSDLVLRIILK